MARRQRRNHSSAVKAKVALAALKRNYSAKVPAQASTISAANSVALRPIDKYKSTEGCYDTMYRRHFSPHAPEPGRNRPPLKFISAACISRSATNAGMDLGIEASRQASMWASYHHGHYAVPPPISALAISRDDTQSARPVSLNEAERPKAMERPLCGAQKDPGPT